ncbi:phosphatidate cytidylyltransferase [Telmatobacter sp. DSM 110680]|uniref:Phosphatidate cytidylyltransferase n=1 Tax=Telmatobacter sp. DSM 110680 TaxID=3036704 RepID=A0AAU7DJD3_9BACT
MKRVLTALVLAPLVLALVFLGPMWLITLVVAAVAMLAAWEFLALTEHRGAKPPKVLTLGTIGLLFMGNFQWPDETATLFGLLSIVLLVYCTFASPVERVLTDATVSVFALFYLGLTLIPLPMLREASNGPSLLAFLFLTVWAGDTVAMYAGRAFGKRKMAPNLSPNKTWAGAIGSVVGAVAVAGILLGLSSYLTQWNSVKLSFADAPMWYWLVLAVIVNVAAQVGDLAESALKRSAGVKDSGTLLPGHGGILDRIDALLLAAPVLWYAQVIRLRF